MPVFRKKPVEIEAVQWNPETKPSTFPEWFWTLLVRYPELFDPATGVLIIQTPEGDMKANTGDWIIRGIAGEIYLCKPHIFAATYEQVGA